MRSWFTCCPRLRSTTDSRFRSRKFELLLASSVPEVELHPASGQSLTADYWVALLPELDLAHVDLGVDAAMIGLTNRLWTVVAESLASARYDHETLPLLLRLWLAHEKGVLGRLVEDSARTWRCVKRVGRSFPRGLKTAADPISTAGPAMTSAILRGYDGGPREIGVVTRAHRQSGRHRTFPGALVLAERAACASR